MVSSRSTIRKKSWASPFPLIVVQGAVSSGIEVTVAVKGTLIVLAALLTLSVLWYLRGFFTYKIPERPSNIPDTAIYGAMEESGHWMQCDKIADLHFACTVYNGGTGLLLLKSQFKLIPNGEGDSPQKLFYTGNHLEADVGELIPVGDYFRFSSISSTPSQYRFYCEEECSTDLDALTEQDYRSLLADFVEKHTSMDEGYVQTIKKFNEVRYAPLSASGPAFICHDGNIRRMDFKGTDNDDNKFTAYVKFCDKGDRAITWGNY